MVTSISIVLWMLPPRISLNICGGTARTFNLIADFCDCASEPFWNISLCPNWLRRKWACDLAECKSPKLKSTKYSIPLYAQSTVALKFPGVCCQQSRWSFIFNSLLAWRASVEEGFYIRDDDKIPRCLNCIRSGPRDHVTTVLPRLPGRHPNGKVTPGGQSRELHPERERPSCYISLISHLSVPSPTPSSPASSLFIHERNNNVAQCLWSLREPLHHECEFITKSTRWMISENCGCIN